MQNDNLMVVPDRDSPGGHAVIQCQRGHIGKRHYDDIAAVTRKQMLDYFVSQGWDVIKPMCHRCSEGPRRGKWTKAENEKRYAKVQAAYDAKFAR
jgi:hypothetical protein